jgi:transposase
VGAITSSVTIWCQRQRIGGDGAVAARRRTGQAASLSRAQELDLVDLIRDRFPEDLGVEGELWTRQGVAALVSQRYGLGLSPAAVDRYLRSWGVTAGSPVERACPLCAAAVARWTADTYPDVQAAATEARADVHWVGRTRLRGVSPAAEVLSAVSTRGWAQFLVLSSRMGTPAVLSREFLLRLGADRAAHLIVDGSWPTADWPRRLPRHMVTHALPSCERT